jgi:hypothetical protein
MTTKDILQSIGILHTEVLNLHRELRETERRLEQKIYDVVSDHQVNDHATEYAITPPTTVIPAKAGAQPEGD